MESFPRSLVANRRPKVVSERHGSILLRRIVSCYARSREPTLQVTPSDGLALASTSASSFWTSAQPRRASKSGSFRSLSSEEAIQTAVLTSRPIGRKWLYDKRAR
jgi:hypothetical protein